MAAGFPWLSDKIKEGQIDPICSAADQSGKVSAVCIKLNVNFFKKFTKLLLKKAAKSYIINKTEGKYTDCTNLWSAILYCNRLIVPMHCPVP